MSNAESVDACRSRTRVTSVIAAVVVGLVVWLVFGLGFWLALILGVIVGFGLFWFLGKSCEKAAAEAAAAEAARQKAERDAAAKAAAASAAPAAGPEPAPAAPAQAEAPAPAPEVVAEPVAAGTETHWSSGVAADSGKASPARGQSALKPSATLADEETLRDGVGEWRYQGAAEAPAAAPEPASAPAAPVAAPEEPAAVAEAEPETLSAARDGGADDLKRIKGVGPGLEKTLNDLGFYHFDQIAAWTDAEIEWVDARLKFKGRIVRDNWIDQARAFAQGG